MRLIENLTEESLFKVKVLKTNRLILNMVKMIDSFSRKSQNRGSSKALVSVETGNSRALREF